MLLYQNWTDSINSEQVISDLSLWNRRWKNKILSIIFCKNYFNKTHKLLLLVSRNQHKYSYKFIMFLSVVFFQGAMR